MHILAALVLLFPAIVSAQGDYPLRTAFSVVKVQSYGERGKVFLGSGVIIAPNEVVTNCHVTKEARSVMIAKGGRRYRVQTQQADVPHDLCLLHADGLDLPPIRVGETSALKTGDGVFFFGYPGGDGISFSRGAIAALYGYDGSRVIETTAGFGLGASGGGLFDAEGRLIGVTTFLPSRRGERFYAVPADWIGPLRRHPPAEVKPLAGSAFWEGAEDVQPYFLRIAARAQAGDWAAVRALAAAWTRAEPSNPQGWLALGRASRNAGARGAALDALKKSVALAPEDPEAWYCLGLAYAEAGESTETETIRRRLADLDRTLADKLKACRASCAQAC